MMKAWIIFIFAGLMLTACNTMEGMGKDVKGAGSSLENTAKKNKP